MPILRWLKAEQRLSPVVSADKDVTANSAEYRSVMVNEACHTMSLPSTVMQLRLLITLVGSDYVRLIRRAESPSIGTFGFAEWQQLNAIVGRVKEMTSTAAEVTRLARPAAAAVNQAVSSGMHIVQSDIVNKYSGEAIRSQETHLIRAVSARSRQFSAAYDIYNPIITLTVAGRQVELRRAVGRTNNVAAWVQEACSFMVESYDRNLLPLRDRYLALLSWLPTTATALLKHDGRLPQLTVEMLLDRMLEVRLDLAPLSAPDPAFLSSQHPLPTFPHRSP